MLVIGGTGRVGKVVTAGLLALDGPRILIGSRTVRPHRAPPSRALAVKVDVDDSAAVAHLLTARHVDVVVWCVEPVHTALHRICMEAGVSIVDISATPDRLEEIEGLSHVAEAHSSTVLLSIGLAPGLTNHLAARVSDDLGGADRVDLTVLLGAGEAHGPHAVRWTLQSLSQGGRSRGTALRSELPGFGPRWTYPMPFSDQFTLRRTLAGPTVTTRMCMDSRVVSKALFSAAGTRAGRALLASPLTERLWTASSGRLHIGTDTFLVMAEGRREDRVRRRWVTGAGQSRITGMVAVLAVRSLLDGGVRPGVWHLEQVPALMASLPSLADTDLQFGASDDLGLSESAERVRRRSGRRRRGVTLVRALLGFAAPRDRPHRRSRGVDREHHPSPPRR